MNLFLISAVILILALTGVISYWLIITTEGVYLGRRVVILLYDLYARRYERIKGYTPAYEQLYLARPLMKAIAPNDAPLVLDVATGTCRLPRALVNYPGFEGAVIGVDLSRKMLLAGAGRVAEAMYHRRVYLMHGPAEALPFPDDTFDVVTCLEALEFMMDPRAVIAELVRVTRPGGQMLLTNRIGMDARLMPGKTWSKEKALTIYREEFGLEAVRIMGWQLDYTLVWARKPGQSLPTRRRSLAEVWRCLNCETIAMVETETAWVCNSCGYEVPVGRDGVIEGKGKLVR